MKLIERRALFIFCAVFGLNTACWDRIEHVYDCGCESDSPPASDGELDAAVDGGLDSDSAEVDTSGQGIRPKGWERFAGACQVHADCTGYPRSRCIDTSILGLINVPGGYCTACCDVAGEYCAEGVQCIGLDNVYLICASSCLSDDDCRQSEGYVCRPVPPYLDTSLFPGNFCLPDDEHMTPPEGSAPSNPECDWPWL